MANSNDEVSIIEENKALENWFDELEQLWIADIRIADDDVVFESGTSGSEIMDQFISENKLKWIPYNKFENIKYLNKGGFGIIYEATYNNYKVILKSLNYLNNSYESLNEFLNKWKIIDSNKIIKIYGFTKDPDTLNYMLAMEYANKGNLRGCLTEITKNWGQKLYMLYKIIIGLKDIHEKGLIHYNFHDGNILCNKYSENVYEIYISDYLRSYQLAKPFSKENSIYGIIPFMAPEILRGKPYTQASDIYSFSMIMWEFTSGIPPFNDKAHDLQLALSICKGERPEVIENTPQCFIDLMKKCWDEDSLKRPSASEILDTIEKWIFLSSNIENNKVLKSNIMEFINAPIGYNNLIVESHLQAYYTSKLLDFTSKELNKILKESQGLKDDDDIEQELLKLGMIAETSSQNELKEVYQNIQIKLVDLQQKNFQFEQDNQILRLNLAVQIKEFAEKENTLQTQITLLQKQALLASDLTENLEQNKLINQQIQIQIDHLEQEKIGLQEKIIQTEANNQELKFQQESLIEQKEQLENKISQPQDNYKAIEQGKIKLHNMGRGLSQDHKLKAKLEKEIAQLEQKLIIEDQIKMQLTQVLQIKEDKVNELEQRLVVLDYERIERLKDKEKELSKVIEELVNKLTSGENTKEIHKEKESKQREMVELQQELSKTSAFYYSNKKKQVLNQANNFLKAKDNFLASREEAIKKLQNCCNNLERFTNKERNTIGSISDMKIFKLADKYTKEFQNTLVKYSDGLLQLNKVYDSLVDIVQKNKELEVSLVVENMLKLNSFNLDKYNIFKFVTNSQEGARTQLNSNMMMEDIDSLRKNLNELKSELKQEKKELKNLAEIRINYIDGSL